MHPEFCIISDRPELLLVDDQNRPHNDNGPFCRWRDGSALYSVHGVRVPMWLIEHPELLTIEKIEAQENAEVKRVMIERYGVSAYLTDSNAEELHRDDFGILYRKEVKDDETIVMVKVVNSTPEPDGTFKDYWLRCDPQLRPLACPDWSAEEQAAFTEKQKPQAMTAKNAVASTFGLRGEDYNPLIET